MSYSQLKLSELKGKYGLTFKEEYGIFNNSPEVNPSSLLTQILQENVPLAVAIGTEKARSELIISPVLVDLRKHFHNQISLFSGVDFNIDTENGLTEICDFMISQSPEQLFIQAPVVTFVIETIYGVVTTGTNWQFLSLNQQNVQIDLEEYSLNQLTKIIGILTSFVNID